MSLSRMLKSTICDPQNDLIAPAIQYVNRKLRLVDGFTTRYWVQIKLIFQHPQMFAVSRLVRF